MNSRGCVQKWSELLHKVNMVTGKNKLSNLHMHRLNKCKDIIKEGIVCIELICGIFCIRIEEK